MAELDTPDADWTTPVGQRMLEIIYGNITSDMWDYMFCGQHLLRIYADKFKVPSAVHFIIGCYFEGMVHRELQQALDTMVHAQDNRMLMLAVKRTANRVLNIDAVVENLFNINRRLKNEYWHLEELSIIVYRHNLLSMRSHNYMLEFQRRVANCQCGTCTGTWNTPNLFSLNCLCECPLCEKTQWAWDYYLGN